MTIHAVVDSLTQVFILFLGKWYLGADFLECRISVELLRNCQPVFQTGFVVRHPTHGVGEWTYCFPVSAFPVPMHAKTYGCPDSCLISHPYQAT